MRVPWERADGYRDEDAAAVPCIIRVPRTDVRMPDNFAALYEVQMGQLGEVT